ncbi:MAG: class I SAM-dependent methyltransferase [Alcaligenaceae bacterium]|nr:class I SAM-dependent methyltransferase [Alcaligenaceae bacterium]
MPPSSPNSAISLVLSFEKDEVTQTLTWRSENNWAPPKRTVLADDTMTADIAYRLASEGVGLIWTGDFQNARQLLQALGRRTAKRRVKYAEQPYPERFHQVRLARAQRARTLGMLLLPFEAHHTLSLRRAPDVATACVAAYGDHAEPYVMPMTELLGVISAYEWRKKGVEVAALQDRIHPHYGVFAPIRAEYLDLISQAFRASPLTINTAFDIGTGTGVIAALLVKQGVKHVVGTDNSARALLCAQDNINRLDMAKHITLKQGDLFPEGQADLIVCNPPWLPGRPASTLEQAVYDQDQHMLLGFLSGLTTHLTPKGQGWLLLSDLAEHLGLRSRAALLAAIERAGLVVLERLDTRPTHPKTKEEADPLADARRAEVTSLWRLAAR